MMKLNGTFGTNSYSLFSFLWFAQKGLVKLSHEDPWRFFWLFLFFFHVPKLFFEMKAVFLDFYITDRHAICNSIDFCLPPLSVQSLSKKNGRKVWHFHWKIETNKFTRENWLLSLKAIKIKFEISGIKFT